MQPLINQIDEARRYLDNAKNLLKENTQIDDETKSYDDPKYVRIAGNTAWNGVLIALEAVFKVKSSKSKSVRPDFNDYIKAAKEDGKIRTNMNNGYEIIHKSMGYDGVTRIVIVKDGFLLAKTIIDWCETKYKAPQTTLGAIKTTKKPAVAVKKVVKKSPPKR